MLLLVAVLALTLPVMAAEGESIYGHVSFVEDQATIIRSDQAEDKAVVNLPLVPGDTIVTGDNGRCELQFDNGTVIRLDQKFPPAHHHRAGSDPDVALENHHPASAAGATVHPAPDV